VVLGELAWHTDTASLCTPLASLVICRPYPCTGVIPFSCPALLAVRFHFRARHCLLVCRRLKQLYLISVAQFRPEKNHRLQLEAFAAAKRRSGTVCTCVYGGLYGREGARGTHTCTLHTHTHTHTLSHTRFCTHKHTHSCTHTRTDTQAHIHTSLPSTADPTLTSFGCFALKAARLKLVGSCRDDADRSRLAQLQTYACELGLEAFVDWWVL